MSEKQAVSRILSDMQKQDQPVLAHQEPSNEATAEHKRRDLALGEQSGTPPVENVTRPFPKRY